MYAVVVQRSWQMVVKWLKNENSCAFYRELEIYERYWLLFWQFTKCDCVTPDVCCDVYAKYLSVLRCIITKKYFGTGTQSNVAYLWYKTEKVFLCRERYIFLINKIIQSYNNFSGNTKDRSTNFTFALIIRPMLIINYQKSELVLTHTII